MRLHQSPVHYSTESGARIYKLNRPKQLNALNYEMISSLVHKVEVSLSFGHPGCLDTDGRIGESLRSVKWSLVEVMPVHSVPGATSRVGLFRPTVNYRLLPGLVLELEKGDSSNALNFFKDEFQLNWAIARLGKPYVSVMHGITSKASCP